MSEQASFELRGRNPDVLTCIAHRGKHEIFMPATTCQPITACDLAAAPTGEASKEVPS